MVFLYPFGWLGGGRQKQGGTGVPGRFLGSYIPCDYFLDPNPLRGYDGGDSDLFRPDGHDYKGGGFYPCQSERPTVFYGRYSGDVEDRGHPLMVRGSHRRPRTEACLRGYRIRPNDPKTRPHIRRPGAVLLHVSYAHPRNRIPYGDRLN